MYIKRTVILFLKTKPVIFVCGNIIILILIITFYALCLFTKYAALCLNIFLANLYSFVYITKNALKKCGAALKKRVGGSSPICRTM